MQHLQNTFFALFMNTFLSAKELQFAPILQLRRNICSSAAFLRIIWPYYAQIAHKNSRFCTTSVMLIEKRPWRHFSNSVPICVEALLLSRYYSYSITRSHTKMQKFWQPPSYRKKSPWRHFPIFCKHALKCYIFQNKLATVFIYHTRKCRRLGHPLLIEKKSLWSRFFNFLQTCVRATIF